MQVVKNGNLKEPNSLRIFNSVCRIHYFPIEMQGNRKTPLIIYSFLRQLDSDFSSALQLKVLYLNIVYSFKDYGC